MIQPLLITGPTASGKSAYALERAAEQPSLIINCDCMQVYRDLRVLTARPTLADEDAVPHALYGFVDGAEAYSVGRYVGDVARALTQARDAGLRPIIVGGTGLYYMALLEGLSPIPPVAPDVRGRWRAAAATLAAAHLHAELARRDRVMAERLSPGDTQRVTRALEVLESTGQSLDVWQRAPGQPLLDQRDCERVVIVADRAALYARADARFDAMIADGVLDEAARLGARNLDPALPIMRAHGIREVLGALDGRWSLDEAAARAKTETRHYIKRQLVWIKRKMIAWKYIRQHD